MPTTYMIIENRELFDGELMTRESLFKALPYADAGDKVLAFDMDEAMRGNTMLRECTEDMVRAAHTAGAFVGIEEHCSVMLPGDYINFVPSKAEIAATKADYDNDLRAEGAL